MSLQICFCLFGGGWVGKNVSWHCLHCACTAALSDRDGWCLCVCLRVVYERRAQRKEATRAVFTRGLLLFWALPVWLWGPGANVWHCRDREWFFLLCSREDSGVEGTEVVSWERHWCVHVVTFLAATVLFLQQLWDQQPKERWSRRERKWGADSTWWLQGTCFFSSFCHRPYYSLMFYTIWFTCSCYPFNFYGYLSYWALD